MLRTLLALSLLSTVDTWHCRSRLMSYCACTVPSSDLIFRGWPLVRRQIKTRGATPCERPSPIARLGITRANNLIWHRRVLAPQTATREVQPPTAATVRAPIDRLTLAQYDNHTAFASVVFPTGRVGAHDLLGNIFGITLQTDQMTPTYYSS